MATEHKQTPEARYQEAMAWSAGNGRAKSWDMTRALNLFHALVNDRSIPKPNLWKICARVQVRMHRRDEVEALAAEEIQCLETAAEEGNCAALYMLGVCYEKGEGVERDLEMAEAAYQVGAALGDATVQNSLGVYYKKILERKSEALPYFESAAQAGHALAQYNLGIMFKYGEGAPENPERALYWFARSAKQGVNFAQEQIEKFCKGEWKNLGHTKERFKIAIQHLDPEQNFTHTFLTGKQESKGIAEWILGGACEEPDGSNPLLEELELRLIAEVKSDTDRMHACPTSNRWQAVACTEEESLHFKIWRARMEALTPFDRFSDDVLQIAFEYAGVSEARAKEMFDGAAERLTQEAENETRPWANSIKQKPGNCRIM